jgi:hypothetical protein
MSEENSIDASVLACCQSSGGVSTLKGSGVAGGEEKDVSLCWFCIPAIKKCEEVKKREFVAVKFVSG